MLAQIAKVISRFLYAFKKKRLFFVINNTLVGFVFDFDLLVLFCRWNLTSILEEYRRYAGQKVRLLNEQFMELFDTDLISVPPDAPEWM